jgi:hypothetical protein
VWGFQAMIRMSSLIWIQGEINLHKLRNNGINANWNYIYSWRKHLGRHGLMNHTTALTWENSPLSSLYYTFKNGNKTYIKMTKVPKITKFWVLSLYEDIIFHMNSSVMGQNIVGVLTRLFHFIFFGPPHLNMLLKLNDTFVWIFLILFIDRYITKVLFYA